MKHRFSIKENEVVAIDFETLYDSKTKYSLKVMTPHDYVRHPRFDPYLVAFASDGGEHFVGSPLDFDWASLDGAHFVAHNATFDGMVLKRMHELRMIPYFKYSLDCTADLCACLGLGRSLYDAVQNILGMTISKKVRADMDGKTLKDLTADEATALYEYGGSDADLCLELWRAKSAEWPQLEIEISRENREANWRGVRINKGATVEALRILQNKAETALSMMPWVKEGEKPTSTTALKEYADRFGLPRLKSYNKTDPLMQAWVKKYAPLYPFIQARLDYSSTAPHISRVEAMIELADHDDVVRFDSLYFGAHTGRSSGSASEKDKSGGARMNFFNIPKGDDDGLTHGVDLRGLIIPRPGRKFIIYDFSNIEPRVTHWVAGSTEFLKLVAKENIYQANAKAMGWFPYDETGLKTRNKKLYQLSKACVIGMSYRMGSGKFLAQCKKMGIQLDPVPKDQWNLDRRLKFVLANVEGIDWRGPENEEYICAFIASDRVVREWREKNPFVTALWKNLEIMLQTAAKNGQKEYTFSLPSGRKKTYYRLGMHVKPKKVHDPDDPTKFETRIETQLCAATSKSGDPMSLHGGVITEHLVQAISRDIMFQGARDVWESEQDWTYIGNVYDEVVFEVPEYEAMRATEVIPRLLCNGTSRAWTKDLPLELDLEGGGIKDKYEK